MKYKEIIQGFIESLKTSEGLNKLILSTLTDEEGKEIIDNLTKALEEAVKDIERIDWLADKDNEEAKVMLPKEAVYYNLGSLRDAIDCTQSGAYLQ